jgi:predicted MFS family arabinose efflux permease
VFPIWLVALLAALASFSIWRFLPEHAKPRSTRAERGGHWRESIALARDPRLSRFLVYGFGLSVVSGVTVQVFGLFTMDRLHVQGEQGAEFTAAGFMVNALALLATQMAVLPRVKLGPRGLMLWGSAITALSVVIQIWAPSLGALLLSQAVQGLGSGLARPGFTGGASVAVEPEEQGAAAGLVVGVNGAGFVFSPLIGGVVYEHFGMNAPLFVTLAILGAMFAFVWMSRRLRDVVIAAPVAEPTTP